MKPTAGRAAHAHECELVVMLMLYKTETATNKYRCADSLNNFKILKVKTVMLSE